MHSIAGRLAGPRLNAITRRLARRGALRVAALRLLALAPYSTVNAVAGASHVRFADFLAGTAVGQLPSIGVTAIFVNRVQAVVAHPGIGTCAALFAVTAAVGSVALFVWRRFGRENYPL